MSSSYEQQVWSAGVSPLSSSRMTHIEEGIALGPRVGEVCWFPWLEDGFLELDGSTVSISAFQRLFDKASAKGQVGPGKTFVDNGDGTFTLPNARDRVLIGAGGALTAGATGGSAAHDHTGGGSTSSAGGHNHTQGDSLSAGAHTHSNPTTSSAGSHDHAFSDATTTADGGHDHTFSDSFTTGAESNQGGAADGALTRAATHTHSGSVSGTTSSQSAHSHKLSVFDMSDAGLHSHTQAATGSAGAHQHQNPDTSSAANHSHTVPEVGETTNLPPHLALIPQVRF